MWRRNGACCPCFAVIFAFQCCCGWSTRLRGAQPAQVLVEREVRQERAKAGVRRIGEVRCCIQKSASVSWATKVTRALTNEHQDDVEGPVPHGVMQSDPEETPASHPGELRQVDHPERADAAQEHGPVPDHLGTYPARSSSASHHTCWRRIQPSFAALGMRPGLGKGAGGPAESKSKSRFVDLRPRALATPPVPTLASRLVLYTASSSPSWLARPGRVGPHSVGDAFAGAAASLRSALIG